MEGYCSSKGTIDQIQVDWLCLMEAFKGVIPPVRGIHVLEEIRRTGAVI